MKVSRDFPFSFSGIYLTFVMALTTVSVIMTVTVLNFFYRGPNLTPVPAWARRYGGVRGVRGYGLGGRGSQPRKAD
jgi:hypothetical protein